MLNLENPPSGLRRAGQRSADRKRERVSIGLQVLLGVLLFFLIDAVVFRSDLYFRWVNPQSSLGTVAQALDNIRHIPAGRKTVLVLGDSRIGEGFSARLATDAAAGLGSAYLFANAAVAGTTPRIWYYLLRRLPIPAERLAAVVIMATSFHDNDQEMQADRRSDITYLHPLLELADLEDFPASFVSTPARREAGEAILFKGFFYKTDLLDFLRNPRKRIHDVLVWGRNGFEWTAAYPGRDTSLDGLALDPASGKLLALPGSKPIPLDGFATYAEQLHRFHGRLPDNEAAAAYRQEWWSRIADLCRQMGVKLLVFRIPRGPLHHLAGADGEPTGALAGLAQAGRLQLLPADQFDYLERPAYFFDDLHLNGAGRRSFSAALAAAVLQRLPAAP